MVVLFKLWFIMGNAGGFIGGRAWGPRLMKGPRKTETLQFLFSNFKGPMFSLASGGFNRLKSASDENVTDVLIG